MWMLVAWNFSHNCFPAFCMVAVSGSVSRHASVSKNRAVVHCIGERAWKSWLTWGGVQTINLMSQLKGSLAAWFTDQDAAQMADCPPDEPSTVCVQCVDIDQTYYRHVSSWTQNMRGCVRMSLQCAHKNVHIMTWNCRFQVPASWLLLLQLSDCPTNVIIRCAQPLHWQLQSYRRQPKKPSTRLTIAPFPARVAVIVFVSDHILWRDQIIYCPH